MEITIKHLRKDKRGVSNAIVVMLSLVMIVIVASNVVLWSYEMSQLDWEKIQEKVVIRGIDSCTIPKWITTHSEYSVTTGYLLSGEFLDTQRIDGAFETFVEDSYGLNISSDFTVDSHTFPLGHLRRCEILIRYNVTDDQERWFVKVYNWSDSRYSDLGFNITLGNQPVAREWNDYAVGVTDYLSDYFDENGTMRLEFHDDGSAVNQSLVSLDFIGIEAWVEGTRFSLKNSGAVTSHIVAIWINDAARHQRFNSDVFLNSGDELTEIRMDIKLPSSNFTARAVTERGNTAIFPL